MDTKAAFEKWFSENMYLADKCFCTEQEKRRMFKAWQASRAAIVIDLPTAAYRRSALSSCANHWIGRCGEIITSHGIRINEKTE